MAAKPKPPSKPKPQTKAPKDGLIAYAKTQRFIGG